MQKTEDGREAMKTEKPMLGLLLLHSVQAQSRHLADAAAARCSCGGWRVGVRPGHSKKKNQAKYFPCTEKVCHNLTHPFCVPSLDVNCKMKRKEEGHDDEEDFK